MHRLGIDVDKGSTTAVVMDQHGMILALAKETTAPDSLVKGIGTVLEKILTQIDQVHTTICDVIIGTDYFANALLEGKHLAKVCSIRIGQAKSTIPPLYGGPMLIHQALGLGTFYVQGGHELDGSPTWIEPCKQDIEKYLRSTHHLGFEAFAITGSFSPVNHSHEKLVADWIHEILGDDYPITMSHELGSIGFLERENSAILNSALSKVIIHSLKGLEDLMKQCRIDANISFTQNDGSLLSYKSVLYHPIRTFGSRISNSFRGASLLTGLQDCVVVDVSHSDVCVGVIEGGFPREKRRNQKMAGISVNLQMPDITRLPHRGQLIVNDELLDTVYHAIQRFQPRFEPLPIVFVGEESAPLAAAFKYPWADVLHPTHYENASAIGTCIAPVSGSVDRIYWLEDMNREETIHLAKIEAIQSAIHAGAIPETVFVQTVETIPLSYMPTKALRIKVKAIGSLQTCTGIGSAG
ncbi:hydantoinase/oxoprolinase N-terminal domain-containing protein [Brevibacillus reuszeri]|uniref:hydantoinase/oxoprolinase N-terminal domain-containing protein n=1 Tax=Brevibacillus reuszeri TaxID=54915 RepID=UPI0013DFA2FB|nr:hydantoinase/oxoprolinase N-terminal domain-containing protein [Brevibacillus reuszeri]